MWMTMDFPSGAVVKNPPASAGDAGDMVWPLDQEDPLEEEMATHSSILAWRILWTASWATVHGVAKSRTRPCVHTWVCEGKWENFMGYAWR